MDSRPFRSDSWSRILSSMPLVALVGAALLGGCQDPESLLEGDGDTDTVADDSPPPPLESPCGETTYGLSVTIRGAVEWGSGASAADASLTLEDRTGGPTVVIGTATADSNGNFTLTSNDVTAIEDCWLSVLSYHLVAEVDGSTEERKINREIWTAIQNDEDIDMTADPIVID